MTAKRFVDYFDKDHNYIIQDLVNEDEYQVGYANCDEDMFLELVNAIAETSCDCITDCEIVVRKLKEENEQLKSEINMLKYTIGRNEAYIGRLTHQSEWSDEAKNTSISSRRCKGDKEI